MGTDQLRYYSNLYKGIHMRLATQLLSTGISGAVAITNPGTTGTIPHCHIIRHLGIISAETHIPGHCQHLRAQLGHINTTA